jgi:hypothetical protein
VPRTAVLGDQLGPSGHCTCIGPKKFAEPVALPSTSPANLPLPRTAYR